MIPKILDHKYLSGRANLKEEAMKMKKCLDPKEFQNFTASNGQSEEWKVSCGVQERRVNGESGELPKYTVTAWMERVLQLTRD